LVTTHKKAFCHQAPAYGMRTPPPPPERPHSIIRHVYCVVFVCLHISSEGIKCTDSQALIWRGVYMQWYWSRNRNVTQVAPPLWSRRRYLNTIGWVSTVCKCNHTIPGTFDLLFKAPGSSRRSKGHMKAGRLTGSRASGLNGNRQGPRTSAGESGLEDWEREEGEEPK